MQKTLNQLQLHAVNLSEIILNNTHDPDFCDHLLNNWIRSHLMYGSNKEFIATALAHVFEEDYALTLRNVNIINDSLPQVKLEPVMTITHNYTPDEIRIIANDLIQKVPVKKIARTRSAEFNRNGSGLIIKVRQIKRALSKGFSIQEIIDKKTTEKYRKEPEAMSQLKFYTKEEYAIIKTAIESGEPIASIVRRLSVEFNRGKLGLYQKIHTIKKNTPVLHTWEGSKRLPSVKKEKLNFEPDVIIQEPAEIGIEVPHGMTFEGKPKKIMLHSDHFRIYF
jgi:hypothetical protein